MFLIKITATATPANKKHPGAVKVWYQGKGARYRWEDSPDQLRGQEWKHRRYAEQMLEVMAAKFAILEASYGMWTHSLAIVETG